MPEPRKGFTVEQLNQMMQSVRSLFDLTTRMDERVAHMMKAQESNAIKIEDASEELSDLFSKLSVVEARIHVLEDKSEIENIVQEVEQIRDDIHEMALKIQQLEIATKREENRWKTAFSFGLQIVWVILTSYLLYRLGLNPGNIP
jgi:chromosome segregation ATPase